MGLTSVVLLEAPFNPARRQKNSVLLAIDLTKAVAEEAIERKDSVVIAYRVCHDLASHRTDLVDPIIFRGLKTLTLADSQQQSLLRLVAEGISVYSPHTALDAAKGGINDWLADVVTGASSQNYEPPQPRDSLTESKTKRPTYQLAHQPSQASTHLNDVQVYVRIASCATTYLHREQIEHTRSAITPSHLDDHPDAGAGRIVRFRDPQPLTDVIDRVCKGMGSPKGFPLAVPQGKSMENITISSVAICAGSGGSTLSPVKNVDLFLTGEMQHHEALAAIERGQCVVTLFHSNSERGFLHAVLREQLRKRLGEEWQTQRDEEKAANLSKEFTEALDDEAVYVDVSERDRDPFGLVVTGS
jgi:dinuclear metal center YbgI/SA1388 family protein